MRDWDNAMNLTDAERKDFRTGPARPRRRAAEASQAKAVTDSDPDAGVSLERCACVWS